MYVERLMKWGKRGLEENVTDLEERETNEERQRGFVNLCPCPLSNEYLHFGNGNSYRLARRKANDRHRCAEQCEELMEGVSPLISLYSVVAITL